MHFFNPVHKMPLVEVVLGRRTSPGAAAHRRRLRAPAGQDAGPGPGRPRLPGQPAARLLHVGGDGAARRGQRDRGDRPARWSTGGCRWGRWRSPTRSASTSPGKVAHILGAGLRRPAAAAGAATTSWSQSGRLGAKNGRGFYRYEGGRAGGARPGGLPPCSASSRGARRRSRRRSSSAWCCRWSTRRRAAWRSGSSHGPGDVDLAMILGTGFPPFRGGLCRWADGQGLGQLVQDLERLAATVAPRFAPSAALRAAAQAGGFYARV